MELNSVLGKARALLEKAEATDYPDEADQLRAKADELMVKYAIDEEALEASRPAAFQSKPETLDIKIARAENKFRKWTISLAQILAEHCRCKIVFYGLRNDYGWVTAMLVGYESDLRYFEMLFTSLHLTMANSLEPEPKPELSFDENVYILHEAGIRWERIASMMNRATRYDGDHWEPREWWQATRRSKNLPNVLVPWPDGHRLINAYKRWCRRIGKNPNAVMNSHNYQNTFAATFVYRIEDRLAEMRRHHGPGTALVRREEAVRDLHKQMFPNLETVPNEVDFKLDWMARNAGYEAANRADLGGTRISPKAKGELG